MVYTLCVGGVHMAIEMKRVNTKLSIEQHEWLEEESKRKGIPKSTLIMMAIEKYMNETNEKRLKAEIAWKSAVERMNQE